MLADPVTVAETAEPGATNDAAASAPGESLRGRGTPMGSPGGAARTGAVAADTPLIWAPGGCSARVRPAVEVVLAAAITVACAVAPTATAWVLLGALWLVLAVQLLVLRPRLNRRTNLVLTGVDVAPSSQHLVYIALEGVKIVLLAAVGIVLII